MGAGYLEVQIAGLPCTQCLLEGLEEWLRGEGYEGFSEEASVLRAYVPRERFDKALLLAHLHALGTGVAVSVVELDEQNWNAPYEAQLQPVELVVAGGLLAIGTPYHPPRRGDWQLTIDPACTFGDGHHPTTQLMLMELHDLLQIRMRVLDVGCGAGILSVAASLWGAVQVDAIDIDVTAVEATRRNVALNGCRNVSVRQLDMAQLGDGRYDIILANVFYQLLVDHLLRLVGMLAPRGVLLASGLLGAQAEQLVLEAERAGLVCLRERALAGWHCVVLAKGS